MLDGKMDPNDVYPSKPLEPTEPPLAAPPQQQYNEPMPDATGRTSQSQDVDMRDTPPKSPEGHDYPDSAATMGRLEQPIPLAPRAPKPRQQSPREPPPPWQPVHVSQYGHTNRQPIPEGYTVQTTVATGQQALVVPQYHPPSNCPAASAGQAPPVQPYRPPLVYSPSVVLSFDPGYQHSLKPRIYRHVHRGIIHELECIPMVYKSAGEETRVIWEVIQDGHHLNYSDEPNFLLSP